MCKRGLSTCAQTFFCSKTKEPSLCFFFFVWKVLSYVICHFLYWHPNFFLFINFFLEKVMFCHLKCFYTDMVILNSLKKKSVTKFVLKQQGTFHSTAGVNSCWRRTCGVTRTDSLGVTNMGDSLCTSKVPYILPTLHISPHWLLWPLLSGTCNWGCGHANWPFRS